MDYGYSWHNDLKGIGKYDRAAFIFGYTAGSYSVCAPELEDCPKPKPGYVEVFSKRKDELGQAGDILTRVEGGYSYDDSGLPSINALLIGKCWHKTRISIKITLVAHYIVWAFSLLYTLPCFAICKFCMVYVALFFNSWCHINRGMSKY